MEPGHGPVLVLGGPGTGKTTTLLRVLTRRLDAGLDPQHVLVLSPTRVAAASLRDDLSAGTEKTFSEPAVRTWSAYAFDLIRRARLDGLLPALQRPPRLLSGPEQDTLIGHLLEGHAQGITPAPEWPESLGEAVGTRGFRKELRELFDRISEHGLEAGALQDLGESLDRPEWVAAAQFYQEYRDLLDLGSAEAFDPAGLLAAAAHILEDNPEFLAAEHERLHLVMVDDLQEANPAQQRLLSMLARGRDLVAFAVPDNVVQGFRGARPDMLGEFEARLGTERQSGHDHGTAHLLPVEPGARHGVGHGRRAHSRRGRGCRAAAGVPRPTGIGRGPGRALVRRRETMPKGRIRRLNRCRCTVYR